MESIFRNSLKEQPLPVYYVITGNPLTLICHAKQDPQSPNQMAYLWLKDSKEISSHSNHFIPTHDRLIILTLDMHQHNGIYTCGVTENFFISVSTQSVTVIVESKW